METIQYVPISIIYYALAALTALIVYGIVGSIYIMGLDFYNAVYFTIITIATVGYGDIIPVNIPQKIFSVTLALGGVGLIAYVFSLTVSVVTMTLQDTISGARIRRLMQSMNNHFILCGFGRVVSAVFKELQKRNQKSIIIEKDREIVEKELWDDPNVLAIPESAADEETLRAAGIKRARGVIITTGDDVDNLFITLTCRELNPDIWIVTRASKRENIKRLYRAGANRVISPEISGGEDIYFAAMEPTMVKITVKHDVDDIGREARIILKHGCTLEDIEYHLPEFKEPLVRKIGVSDGGELERFLKILERDPARKSSLKRIYESVSGIHSHWISGPDRESIDAVIDELKSEGILLGVNLNDEEIKEVARKHGRLVEIIIKPEMSIVENHGVDDIRREAEIIINHGCTIEDIEYYLPGFSEPLRRNVGVSSMEEIDSFMKTLKSEPRKLESLDRLYTLSGGGIHSHRISGPDSKSLELVERELREEGFLIGVNLELSEIKSIIQESGRVVEMLLKHDLGNMDDKEIIIRRGGRILDSKHYLPGVKQVVTRNLNIRNMDDLKRCMEELENPDARRSLKALYSISRNIHSHTVAAADIKIIMKIEDDLRKRGILLGVNLREDEIWEIVESEMMEKFCIE
ncbi:3H domain-containing protein [Methanothermobacter thermautotrophicus]|uniref:3H domain-containing protein n=1 Tax=Methanothermobacter thermautotrophicus TaxID=145262 RepID=UPI0022B89093|nr:3H domain-containing protein [Methanothermobacter thermautotrophicus]